MEAAVSPGDGHGAARTVQTAGEAVQHTPDRRDVVYRLPDICRKAEYRHIVLLFIKSKHRLLLLIPNTNMSLL